MAFDQGGRVASDGHRFNDIRIERILGPKTWHRLLLGCLAKDVDEGLTDDLALSLRVGHALEFFQEKRGGVFVYRRRILK